MNCRIHCINPRCNRTFKADNPNEEIICGKCFKMLAEATRKEHRGYWREIRKWDRRITRTGDELKISRMHAIRHRISVRLSDHWDTDIKAVFLAPEKPEGIDQFIEEIFG